MLLAKSANFDICLVQVGEAFDRVYWRRLRCSMMSGLLPFSSRLFQLDVVAGSSNKQICCLSYFVGINDSLQELLKPASVVAVHCSKDASLLTYVSFYVIM